MYKNVGPRRKFVGDFSNFLLGCPILWRWWFAFNGLDALIIVLPCEYQIFTISTMYIYMIFILFGIKIIRLDLFIQCIDLCVLAMQKLASMHKDSVAPRRNFCHTRAVGDAGHK